MTRVINLEVKSCKDCPYGGKSAILCKHPDTYLKVIYNHDKKYQDYCPLPTVNGSTHDAKSTQTKPRGRKRISGDSDTSSGGGVEETTKEERTGVVDTARTEDAPVSGQSEVKSRKRRVKTQVVK